METRTHRCESCSMPIESGKLCRYCQNEHGELQPFAERFEKMVGWQLGNRPGLSRAEAERQTLDFMSKMPAWREHPDLRAALAARSAAG